MRKNIAFYISNHGFGHASRNIPIIKTLLKLEDEICIYIKTAGNQLSFMRQHIGEDERLIYCEQETDVGLILKEGTLLVDQKRLEMEIREYVAKWDELEQQEEGFFKEKQIGLVVADICPWALEAADHARIKSLLITNFTWVEIYQEYLPEELWDAYLRCYEMASKVLIYDVHQPPLLEYNPEYELVSLVCREFCQEKVEEIQKVYKKPLVYVSVGMSADLEEEIDVGGLPYHFIVTPGLKVRGENVTNLPPNTKDAQNYVAACTYVISKAGWSTVAEILLSNKKAALLKRDTVAEDRITIETLKNREQCIEIETKELFHMDKILEKLEQFHFSYEHEYHNDDYEIAKKILFAYPERRRRVR
ncbi:MAG: hypothetical protein Q4B70_12640 [Lachnospiraceae bacterium]|nr:hypothetical protein [Lachnospiraceae bacterium]